MNALKLQKISVVAELTRWFDAGGKNIDVKRNQGLGGPERYTIISFLHMKSGFPFHLAPPCYMTMLAMQRTDDYRLTYVRAIVKHTKKESECSFYYKESTTPRPDSEMQGIYDCYQDHFGDLSGEVETFPPQIDEVD